jgi:hypothetical protein
LPFSFSFCFCKEKVVWPHDSWSLRPSLTLLFKLVAQVSYRIE